MTCIEKLNMLNMLPHINDKCPQCFNIVAMVYHLISYYKQAQMPRNTLPLPLLLGWVALVVRPSAHPWSNSPTNILSCLRRRHKAKHNSCLSGPHRNIFTCLVYMQLMTVRVCNALYLFMIALLYKLSLQLSQLLVQVWWVQDWAAAWQACLLFHQQSQQSDQEPRLCQQRQWTNILCVTFSASLSDN